MKHKVNNRIIVFFNLIIVVLLIILIILSGYIAYQYTVLSILKWENTEIAKSKGVSVQDEEEIEKALKLYEKEKLIVYKDLTVDYDSSNEEILKDVYDFLPSNLIDYINENDIDIQIIRNKEEFIAKYIDEMDLNDEQIDYTIISEVNGFTTPESKVYIRFAKGDEYELLSTIIHELGHALDFKLGKWSNNVEFQQAYYKEFMVSHVYHNINAEYYNNTTEYFAEMFASYLMNDTPEHRVDLEYCPKTFNAITKFIDSF